MRVLVIEDDAEVVEIVSLCFEARWPEARVLHAELGEYGIEMARSENPDIVILDLGLPGHGRLRCLRSDQELIRSTHSDSHRKGLSG